MTTVKNKPVLFTFIEVDNKDKNKGLVKVYFDNLAIEIKTDKLNGGY